MRVVSHAHLIIINCGIFNINHRPLTALSPASKPSATAPKPPGFCPALLLLPHLLLRLRECIEEGVLMGLASCLLLPGLRSCLQGCRPLTDFRVPVGTVKVLSRPSLPEPDSRHSFTCNTA